MANRIFDNILIDEIESFEKSFSNTSKDLFTNDSKKLIHPGEFGTYREAIARRFLKSFCPAYIDVDQGFLINTNDEVSTQCDIIAYDRRYTPMIKSKELQRFFPVETVAAIGEVKSTLSFTEFKTALNKLAKSKKMTEYIESPWIVQEGKIKEFKPDTNPFDLAFSFLVCQKLNFKLDRIVEAYENDVQLRHRHNIILSIEDGLILYDFQDYAEKGIHIFPTVDGKSQQAWISYSKEKNGINCYKVFCNYLFQSICSRTKIIPQISDYMLYQ